MSRNLRAAFLLAFMAFFAQNAGAADIFDRMMSPGDLNKKHEKLGDNCRNCHVAFDKKGQSKLCRTCHKPIDKQVLQGIGYHGKDPRVRTATCSQCHAEHKGRNAPLTVFDRDNFNHEFTNYPLRGGHKQVACSSCHKAGSKFSSAPTSCFDCHREDDKHRGRLGSNCASCHSDSSWKSTKFDHSATRFPLKGKHASATCESCHPDQRYEKTPRDCFSCHQLDDKHKGSNGRSCENCHTTSKWSAVSFDHSKTRFPLSGRHAQISCNACHTGGGTPTKLPLTCISCHKQDDTHKGANGTKCESCHNARSWKQATFDHSKETQFPLRGAHAKATCQNCHKPDAPTRKIAMSCYSCHQKDDVHKGQEGRSCEKCHNEVSWSGKVKFDHGLTKFPLVGLHAATPCEECHRSAAYQDAPVECGACHKKDDEHKGTLGPRCGDCHNPNGWSFWQFDHARQTDFPLTGKHAGLACGACHKKKSEEKAIASSSCVSCHRSDDVHHGDFGEQCEACHTANSFSALRKR